MERLDRGRTEDSVFLYVRSCAHIETSLSVDSIASYVDNLALWPASPTPFGESATTAS